LLVDWISLQKSLPHPLALEGDGFWFSEAFLLAIVIL